MEFRVGRGFPKVYDDNSSAAVPQGPLNPKLSFCSTMSKYKHLLNERNCPSTIITGENTLEQKSFCTKCPALFATAAVVKAGGGMLSAVHGLLD
mgnify:CR=1 FL=1|tara:strand:+ start:4231 stop:4512 length:282 start_codon:yes stop_codon:yes gene_type:complete